jgi:Lsr2
MAQRFQVLLVCDLHDDETPGTETVSFAVDGTTYEIDTCDAHAAELRDAFAPYVAAGRRAGRGVAGASGRRRRGGHRPAGGVDPAAVRAWARSNNVKVSERGRISADILERYAAAKK